MSDCQRHSAGLQSLQVPVPVYEEAVPFQQFSSAWWFLAANVCDVWSQLDTLLAAVTSTYGGVLKIDSTKKVCKKLQGAAANSANWATNVGNEKGEVLQFILTAPEDMKSLLPLAEGLVKRFEQANQPPPLEAMCILLCQRITGPQREPCPWQRNHYTSRWKLMVWEYNK